MKLKMPTVIASTFVLALAALAVQTGRIELRADLRGATRAKGKAVWKFRAQGARVQAELEVEGENLPRNADLTVEVASMAPISVTTSAFGTFEINRRFNAGTAPTIVAGDHVTVSDVNETELMGGVFVVR
jgi:hypothetical protein